MAVNPFEPPKSQVSDNDLPETLTGYTPAEVRKLYLRSRNVSAIAFLIMLGAIALVAILLLAPESLGSKPLFIGILVFHSFAIVGILKRTSWGRILGIIVCALSLINFPIGTVIGIFGLVAFIKAKELFGPDRITHAEVKLAFKELKAAKAF